MISPATRSDPSQARWYERSQPETTRNAAARQSRVIAAAI
jgi:hypothetical protein